MRSTYDALVLTVSCVINVWYDVKVMRIYNTYYSRAGTLTTVADCLLFSRFSFSLYVLQKNAIKSRVCVLGRIRFLLSLFVSFVRFNPIQIWSLVVAELSQSLPD